MTRDPIAFWLLLIGFIVGACGVWSASQHDEMEGCLGLFIAAFGAVLAVAGLVLFGHAHVTFTFR